MNTPVSTTSASDAVQELTAEEIIGWVAQKLFATGEVSPNELNVIINALTYDYSLFETLIYYVGEQNGGEYPVDACPAPRLGIAITVERARRKNQLLLQQLRAKEREQTNTTGDDVSTDGDNHGPHPND